MYKEYFHLKESPFRLNTDTHYLYLSKEHAKAKAYLEYALLNDENLLVLTGEIGAGKSILIQNILDNLDDAIIAVKIHQTQLSVIEFLQLLLLEFGIKSFNTGKIELLNLLKEFLLSVNYQGKKALLVIDEAQNLNKEVLEEIRFLADLEIDSHKLLNVFLVGQPELNNNLEQPGMEQLTQRVRLKFHLEALNEDDIKEYIIYRINKAGEHHTVKITGEVIPLIYSYTGGRPRLINVLCDHALTCAFVDKQKSITKEILESAINELSWIPFGKTVDKDLPARAEQSGDEPMIAKLVIFKGSELIGEFPISTKTINIGRSHDNDVILNDSRISRVHAQITNSNNEIYISDMRSRNGTFLDLKQINFASLKHGSEITIARFKLKFVECNEEQKDSFNIIQYPTIDSAK